MKFRVAKANKKAASFNYDTTPLKIISVLVIDLF
nr:hypothetical protein [Mucilaginibacter sp. X4EP1]